MTFVSNLWPRLKLFLPPVFLMGLIFYLSSRPAFAVSPEDWLNFLFFKSMHFLEYFLLFILWYRAFRNVSVRVSPFWGAALMAFFWSVTDEIHQLYVPSRQGSLRDIAIDTLGILFGLFCLWIILPKAPKKLRNWAEKLGLA